MAILVGEPLPILHDAVAAQAKFAVVFAAGFAEVGAKGETPPGTRWSDIIAGGDLHVLGPNTNLNAFEVFRDDLPGQAIALITQSGHQGRPVFQGQEIGIKLSHWAPAGNEADLESADFINYFSEPRSTGAVACYIEGFKNGRTLQLAADAAARRKVPDRRRQGGPDRRGHVHGQGPHRPPDRDPTTSSPPSSASTACNGSTGSTSCSRSRPPSPAPSRRPRRRPRRLTPRRRRPGLRVLHFRGHRGPHGRHGRGGRPRTALTHQVVTDAAARMDPALPACVEPRRQRWRARCATGGAPRSSRRCWPTPTSTCCSAPSPAPCPSMANKLCEDLVAAAATTDKPRLRGLGLPGRHRGGLHQDAAREHRADLPHLHQRGHGGQGLLRPPPLRRLLRVGLRPPGPPPAPAADEGPARSSAPQRGRGGPRRAQPLANRTPRRCSRPTASRCPKERMVDLARRGGQGGEEDRLPGGHEDRLGRHPAQVRPRAWSPSACGTRTTPGAPTSACVATAKKAAPKATIDGVLVAQMVQGIETVVGIAQDDLFGPVVMFGLGGVLVEVLRDVTFRVPPFTTRDASAMLDELRGAALLRGVRGQPAADRAAPRRRPHEDAAAGRRPLRRGGRGRHQPAAGRPGRRGCGRRPGRAGLTERRTDDQGDR